MPAPLARTGLDSLVRLYLTVVIGTIGMSAAAQTSGPSRLFAFTGTAGRADAAVGQDHRTYRAITQSVSRGENRLSQQKTFPHL